MIKYKQLVETDITLPSPKTITMQWSELVELPKDGIINIGEVPYHICNITREKVWVNLFGEYEIRTTIEARHIVTIK